MGKNDKAIIIEFNGLPGVGKSTVAKELEQLIQERGITCYRSYLKRPINKRVVSLLFSPELFRLLPSVLRYSRKYRGGFSKYRYVLGFLMICRQYRHFLTDVKSGVLVIDQGVAQEYISIAHVETICNSEHLLKTTNAVKKDGISFIRVDCDVQEKKVFERLKERSNGGSRLECNEDAEIYRLLKIQQNNLQIVRETMDNSVINAHITIDTLNSPRENAELIWNFVYE